AIVLLVLIGVALYFASSPLRTRYQLEHASLPELQQQAAQNPTDFQIHYYLARRARLDGNYSLALDTYKTLGEADPHDQNVWLEWSQTAASAGSPATAIGVLRAFCNVNPQNAPGHAALANLYLAQHNNSLASAEATLATKSDPNNPNGWAVLGKATLALEQYVPASSAFNRAISLSPSDWHSIVGLGDVQEAQGQVQQAVSLYSKAVALKPPDGTPYERLGYELVQTAASNSDLDRAKQALLKAVSLGDTLSSLDRVNAYLSLGQAYEREDQWKDALPMLQKAETLNPDNSSIHYELARVYGRLGDDANAAQETSIHESFYNRAMEGASLTNHLQIDPGDSAARLKLARLYVSYRDYHNAILQYTLLLQHDPGSEAAKKEMGTLKREYPDAAR
ncbi:MAG TPA: tetratricopeptide repeat protein, partial [Capsulimonadaceae bacterium]|nr:tetratricopeptide repeat protein [Capsulimonadaceae bacterium]